MRKREEIENSPSSFEKLTLEVLLDIRDLMGGAGKERTPVERKRVPKKRKTVRRKKASDHRNDSK